MSSTGPSMNSAVASRHDPPRVLMVHNYYRTPGGEDRVFEAETGLLRDNGIEVETFIRRNTESDRSNAALAARWFWDRGASRDLEAAIRRFGPTVVHLHNTRPLVSTSAFYAASNCGVPVVHTLHNYVMTCFNGMLYRNGRARAAPAAILARSAKFRRDQCPVRDAGVQLAFRSRLFQPRSARCWPELGPLMGAGQRPRFSARRQCA